MIEKSLRDLAREHAKGNLSREAYRKARAELVEGILSGKILVKDIEFRAPLESGDPSDGTDATVPRGHKKKTGISPDPATASQTAAVRGTAPPPSKGASESRGRGGKLAWIAGAIVLLLLAAAFLAVFGHSHSSPPAPTHPSSDYAPATDNAATRLITEFLGHEDWSNAGMDKFLARWSALPAQTRAAAAGSVAQGQLATDIYKQLLEERALSGLGDVAKSQTRQQRLMDFAHQVGINYPRLVVKP